MPADARCAAQRRLADFHLKLPDNIPKSLNTPARAKELHRITEANAGLLQRIVTARPSIDREAQERDFEARTHLMQQLARASANNFHGEILCGEGAPGTIGGGPSVPGPGGELSVSCCGWALPRAPCC